LWTLLEAALLTPHGEESTLSARGLALRYANGAVHAQPLTQWLAAQTGDHTQRAHDFAGTVFELRQYAALLDAHHIPLRLENDEASASQGHLLEVLADVDPGYDAPALFAHEAPGLGIVAVTVAQRGDGGRARALAHGYPLQPSALGPLVSLLAERFGTPTDVHALGRVLLDDAGQLGAPATPLH
jgi:hypothetical protein